MFRSGCITIVVLTLLGFAFEEYSYSFSARVWASIEKQLNAISYACPGGCPMRKVVVTRLRASGQGNIEALKKDLTGIGEIEVDKNGVYLDFNHDVKVVLNTATKDSSYIGFVVHTLCHHGFQIVEMSQSTEYQPVIEPCANF